MRNKLFLVASLLIVASMVLAACAPAPAEPSEPQTVEVVKTVVVTEVVEGETQTIVITATPAPEEPEAKPAVLRVDLGTYPDIIDPQKSSFVNEIAHLQLNYEGLTRLDENLETQPAAAEKWEYNEDATELTFTLREGLTYSDGSPLNAKRFEYSILRNINPETAGEYAQITDDIAGAAEWRSADPAAEDYDAEALKANVKVQALDSAGNPCADYEQADCLTLKIGLKQPAPYFHTVMALWVTFPAKEELISEGGENWWNSSKYQIGNGPFILKSLEPFVRGVYEPNPNYWGDKPTYTLEYTYITDSAVSFEAYKNNELDIIEFASEDLATIMADPALSADAQIYPGSCTFALMFHQLKEPFTDKAVREAFAYALDREAWVNDVLQGLGSPTLTWIPPGFPGFQEGETRYGYDPEKAKQTLADAGYTVENGTLIKPDGTPIEITATFSDTPRNRTRWEWLTAKYKENLGVEFKLNPVESTTFTALTKDINTAPQMFILGWCADYPDPQNWLSVYWKTGAFGERIGFSDPEMDAIMNEADATLDPAKRMELYAQAQEMLVAKAAVAFFWNNVNHYLVKPWVTGYNKTPMDAGWLGAQTPWTIQVDTSMMP
jgi:oligopeptide transport system substrate-binding protein